ncbi:serine-threonine kinase [Orpheovirus IHUMI-LCC2]|uniref:Serine/Threonine protein kinase n=1 Tax=Orpheovirus IHUMI-LCC2 TaxID=2023057 RepID=A0A2I2L608_9VIRU|nr:serine-threonine kinase [Orpheovirus IHUMI-LCC2]SNW62889.1 Serine/Threonine protein kinase [Orpheovirus IHUMI-LCC2]
MSCSYKFGNLLGQGSYGVVYDVQDSSGNNYAMKITKALGDVQFMEMNILKSSNHPNVARAKYLITNGTCKTQQGIGYVSDLALTDLHGYLSQQNYSVTFDNRLKIAWDITDGLRHLHDNNFIHLDLKPENILIYGSYENPTAVISDFGLSSLLEQDKDDADFGSARITAPYRPPENFSHESREYWEQFTYGKYSDIWSLGLIYIQLFSEFTSEIKEYIIMNNATPRGYYPAIFTELVSRSKLSDINKIPLKDRSDIDFSKIESTYYRELVDKMSYKELNSELLEQPGIDYTKLSKLLKNYRDSGYEDVDDMRDYLVKLILNNKKNIATQDKWKLLPRTSYEEIVSNFVLSESPSYYNEIIESMDEDDLLGYIRNQPLASSDDLDRILLLPQESRKEELESYLYPIMLSQTLEDLLLLIRGMLMADKHKRLSILDVLSHNFFVNLGYSNSISNNILIPERYSLRTKGTKEENKIVALIKEFALIIKYISSNIDIKLRTFFVIMDIYYRAFTYISIIDMEEAKNTIVLIMLAAIYIGLGIMGQPYIIDDIVNSGNDIVKNVVINKKNVSMMVKRLCQEFGGIFYREYLWERADTMDDIEDILNNIMFDPITYIDVDLDAYFGRIIKSNSKSPKKTDTYLNDVRYFNEDKSE